MNKFKLNLKYFYDISITQNFDNNQPNSFGVVKAKSEPYRVGDFVGDTNKGSSCNFDQLSITPHCNGTHTECIGHILNSRNKITDLIDDIFTEALLITCDFTRGNQCQEKYLPKIEKDDLLITAKELENKIGNQDLKNQGLIIRTLPNSISKISRDYDDDPGGYFTNDAMKFLYELKVKHLLVDLPSVDKSNDDGMLSNHRIFWNVELGKKESEYNEHHHKTITEFIYIDNKIQDGRYMVNLQIAPFGLDASPSRPILIKLE